jgi:hypothetical protein
MAHELGHMHGRQHAPCGVDGDTSYPYASARIGDWGYYAPGERLLAPTSFYDVMSYCWPQWISDYSYDGILERAAAVNTLTFEHRALTQPRRFWTLVSESGVLRWGLPLKLHTADGTREPAQALDHGGRSVAEIDVHRSEVGHTGAFSYLVPEPLPGWSTLRLASGDRISFALPSSVKPLVPHAP